MDKWECAILAFTLIKGPLRVRVRLYIKYPYSLRPVIGKVMRIFVRMKALIVLPEMRAFICKYHARSLPANNCDRRQHMKEPPKHPVLNQISLIYLDR